MPQFLLAVGRKGKPAYKQDSRSAIDIVRSMFVDHSGDAGSSFADIVARGEMDSSPSIHGTILLKALQIFLRDAVVIYSVVLG